MRAPCDRLKQTNMKPCQLARVSLRFARSAQIFTSASRKTVAFARKRSRAVNVQTERSKEERTPPQSATSCRQLPITTGSQRGARRPVCHTEQRAIFVGIKSSESARRRMYLGGVSRRINGAFSSPQRGEYRRISRSLIKRAYRAPNGAYRVGEGNISNILSAPRKRLKI